MTAPFTRLTSAPISRRQWGLACSAWLGAAAAPSSASAASSGATQMHWPDQVEVLDGPPLPAERFKTLTTVLVFFSIDCPYCRRHNQRLSALALQTPKLRVLGGALDTDLGALRQYRSTQGLKFDITPGAQALRERVTSRRVIPFTAVITPSGQFLELIPGEMSESDILGLARWAYGA